MSSLQTLFAAISAVVLFLYGLQGFSRELRAVGGEPLQAWLSRVTASRWLGFGVGALTTAVLQSSSAVTALTVALVDASVIPFKSSLGIVLGANVGTTATAWLVSFKLTGIGPFFIVLGTLLSSLPLHVRIAGKAVFYFGLIFFALDLIAAGLQPLQDHATFRQWLALAHQPWLGVLAGVGFTALIQSSSVTSGLAILLVQQGTLPAAAAIPIVLGANVGSTTTALVASVGMSAAARATAKANLMFNVIAVALYLPFLPAFARAMLDLAGNPGMAVALAHLVFNATLALLFLLTLDFVEPRLRARLGERAPSGASGGSLVPPSTGPRHHG
jgi:Na/Pi-cotransporter